MVDKKHILVIDDESKICILIKEILEWILIKYPQEVNKICLYADIGNHNSDGVGDHFVMDLDHEEKLFREIWDDNYLSRLESTFKDIKLEKLYIFLQEMNT